MDTTLLEVVVTKTLGAFYKYYKSLTVTFLLVHKFQVGGHLYQSKDSSKQFQRNLLKPSLTRNI